MALLPIAPWQDNESVPMLELSPAASFVGSSDVQVMYTFESVMSGMPKRQLSAVMSTRVTWSGAAPPLVVGPVSLVSSTLTDEWYWVEKATVLSVARRSASMWASSGLLSLVDVTASLSESWSSGESNVSSRLSVVEWLETTDGPSWVPRVSDADMLELSAGNWTSNEVSVAVVPNKYVAEIVPLWLNVSFVEESSRRPIVVQVLLSLYVAPNPTSLLTREMESVESVHASYGSPALLSLDRGGALSKWRDASWFEYWSLSVSVRGLSSSWVSNASVDGVEVAVSSMALLPIAPWQDNESVPMLELSPAASFVGSSDVQVMYTFESVMSGMPKRQLSAVMSTRVTWSGAAPPLVVGPVSLVSSTLTDEWYWVEKATVLSVARRSASMWASSGLLSLVDVTASLSESWSSGESNVSSRLSVVEWLETTDGPSWVPRVSDADMLELSAGNWTSNEVSVAVVPNKYVAEIVPLWLNVSFVEESSRRPIVVQVLLSLYVAPNPTSLLTREMESVESVHASYGSPALLSLDRGGALSKWRDASWFEYWSLSVSVRGLSSSWVSNASVDGVEVAVSSMALLPIAPWQDNESVPMLELSPAASFVGSSDVQVMYTFESVMSGMPKRQLSAVMSTRVTWSGAAPPLVVGPVSLVSSTLTDEWYWVEKATVLSVARRSASMWASSGLLSLVDVTASLSESWSSGESNVSSRLSVVEWLETTDGPSWVPRVSDADMLELSAGNWTSNEVSVAVVPNKYVAEIVPLWLNVSFVEESSRRPIVVQVLLSLYVAPNPTSLLTREMESVESVHASYGSPALLSLDRGGALSKWRDASWFEYWSLSVSVRGLSSSWVSNASVDGVEVAVSSMALLPIAPWQDNESVPMLELSPAASFVGSSDVQVMYTFESVMSGMPKRQLSAVMSTRVTWSGAAPPLVVGPVSLVSSTLTDEWYWVEKATVLSVARRSASMWASSGLLSLVDVTASLSESWSSGESNVSSRLSVVEWLETTDGPSWVPRVSDADMLELSAGNWTSNEVSVAVVPNKYVAEIVPLWLNVSFVEESSRRPIVVQVLLSLYVAPNPTSLLTREMESVESVHASYGSPRCCRWTVAARCPSGAMRLGSSTGRCRCQCGVSLRRGCRTRAWTASRWQCRRWRCCRSRRGKTTRVCRCWS
ncbi:hypothetical protein PINS_up003367 [Pythium insidiosum]|nr:hypothetical protein PINS_up003367 [Pythium insidiosum]